MSEAIVNETVIKTTQDTLGKFVRKPVLSEKLLKKPPFRFLHDVIKTVIRDTGCFEGLYTPEELNFENINDRDAKMRFLQKMIDAIKIATNNPLTTKPSKIVAGHEPEKTNELLQLIGNVIENKIDWKPAVESVSSGGTSPNPKSKPKDKEAKEKKTVDKLSPKADESKKSDRSRAKAEVKEKTKSNEVREKASKKSLKSLDSDKKEEKKLKTKHSTKDISKRSSLDKVKRSSDESPKIELDSKPAPKSKSDDSSKLKVKSNEAREPPKKEPIENEIKDENKPQTPVENGSSLEEFKRDDRHAIKRAEEILLAAAAEEASGPESRRSSGSKRSSGRSRRSSAEKSRTSKVDDINGKMAPEPTDSLKTVTEEPSPEAAANATSKSPPGQDSTQSSDVKRETTFVRENSKEAAQNPPRPRTSLRPPSARPASARPGAPRRRDKNIEIILQPNDKVKLSGISVKLETFNTELEDDGENLVIIENPHTVDPLQETLASATTLGENDSAQQGHLVQQILETQKELVQGGSTDSEQKLDKDNDINKLNARQSSARQMYSLRDVIQNLTKSVNPLGKLMDFIPEDIDAMQLELIMWRDTYNQSSVELKKERSLTESVTEPMKNQLVGIESTIKEYHEMIDSSRAKILQNAEKIQRLLTTQ